MHSCFILKPLDALLKIKKINVVNTPPNQNHSASVGFTICRVNDILWEREREEVEETHSSKCSLLLCLTKMRKQLLQTFFFYFIFLFSIYHSVEGSSRNKEKSKSLKSSRRFSFFGLIFSYWSTEWGSRPNSPSSLSLLPSLPLILRSSPSLLLPFLVVIEKSPHIRHVNNFCAKSSLLW